tara:strand:+ start:10 stop:465 length:456 start_codon:yes stop_codon:yes gene_type:complete
MNLSSKNKPNPNFSMSSMTDLIFILLIFFLVTSSSSSIDYLPFDIVATKNPQQIQKEDVNIFVTIKKDASCDSYNYTLNNSNDNYCGWEDVQVPLSNLINKIDTNKEKKFSAIIVVVEKGKVISDEIIENVIDFASKYDYNIGIKVDKLDK